VAIKLCIPFLSTRPSQKKRNVIAFVSLFVAVGVIVLISVDAAVANWGESILTQTGIVAGNASVVANSSAIGGKAVQFKSGVISPTPTATPAPTTTTLTNLSAQSAFVMYYGDTTRGVAYEHPGALVVTGRGNYQDQTFKDISAAGGTALAWWSASQFLRLPE
jgi:hypothetical protein